MSDSATGTASCARLRSSHAEQLRHRSRAAYPPSEYPRLRQRARSRRRQQRLRTSRFEACASHAEIRSEEVARSRLGKFGRFGSVACGLTGSRITSGVTPATERGRLQVSSELGCVERRGRGSRRARARPIGRHTQHGGRGRTDRPGRSVIDLRRLREPSTHHAFTAE